VKRRKRYTVLGIALGLAIAATIPTIAPAKPLPSNQDVEDHGGYVLGPGEIPYFSSNDRVVATSPDDRSFSRATQVDTSPVATDNDGRSVDVNAYTVSGLGLAMLLAIGFGAGIAVWQSRRTKLSPA
jgi:hypothetical protein